MKYDAEKIPSFVRTHADDCLIDAIQCLSNSAKCVHKANVERLGEAPKRQNGHVVFSALHTPYVRSMHAATVGSSSWDQPRTSRARRRFRPSIANTASFSAMPTGWDFTRNASTEYN